MGESNALGDVGEDAAVGSITGSCLTSLRISPRTSSSESFGCAWFILGRSGSCHVLVRAKVVAERETVGDRTDMVCLYSKASHN
jgi:hypothetical protein